MSAAAEELRAAIHREWSRRQVEELFEAERRREEGTRLRELVERVVETAFEWDSNIRNETKPETTISIYALMHDGTAYIGQSIDPEWRYTQHMDEARRAMPPIMSLSPKLYWLVDLIRQGIEPELRILEVVPKSEANEAENRWWRWACERYEVKNGKTP
jgi:hypothetical protein